MLLPGIVSVLVSEKENGLRMMMKMQGMHDLPYYYVQYSWASMLFTAFMGVFAAGGYALQLTVFTKTEWSLQLIIYALWGNVLVAWGTREPSFSPFFPPPLSRWRSPCLRFP